MVRPHVQSGMNERLQNLCRTPAVDAGDRAAFMKRFGRIASAAHNQILHAEILELRRTIVYCIDHQLAELLAQEPEEPAELRDILLEDSLGASPETIVGIVHPDPPVESMGPLLDLIALVQAVDELEMHCKERRDKVVRRVATNASLTIANYERCQEEESDEDHALSADTRSPASEKPRGTEQPLFSTISGFKGTRDASPLLECLSHPANRFAVEKNPVLISRALYILSTVPPSQKTMEAHTACVQWLCEAGNSIASQFQPIATSNSLLGIAKMRYRVNGQSGAFVENLLAEMVQNQSRLDAATIRTSLWSLARLGYTYDEIHDKVDYLCKEGALRVSQFNSPQAISNCLSALGDLEACSPDACNFVHRLSIRGILLIERNPSGSSLFSPQEASSSLRSLAKIGLRTTGVDTFMRLLTKGVHAMGGQVEPRHSATIAYALARHGVHNGSTDVRTSEEAAEFFSVLCTRTEVEEFNAHDLTDCLWALATLGQTITGDFEQEMHTFVRTLCRRAISILQQEEHGAFQPGQISICLWSLAHLGTQDRIVQQFIDEACAYGDEHIETFDAQNAENSSWGLAVLSGRYDVPNQGRVFLRRAAELLDNENPESVRQLYHANLALTRSTDIELYCRVRSLDFQTLFGSSMLTGSTEKNVVRELKEGTEAPRFMHGVCLHGFQLDLLSEDMNVNIEIDGPHHRDREEIDIFRDRLLREQGIQVIRISEDAAMERLEEIRDILLSHGGTAQ